MECEIQVSYDGLLFLFNEDGYCFGNQNDMLEAIEECIRLKKLYGYKSVRLTIQSSLNPDEDTIFLITDERRFYSFT